MELSIYIALLSHGECFQFALYSLQSPITDNKRKRYKKRKIASLPPTFLHIGLILSTIRTPFKEISGNRPNGKYLSPYWRGVIAGEDRTGGIHTEIAKELKIDRETIRHTHTLEQMRDIRM